MLVALNHAFDRKSMDLLLFLKQQTFSGTYFSADGLLQFAGLIAAGLVTQGAAVGGGLSFGNQVSTSVHQVRLTKEGELLVEAWLAGDEDAYRALVGG